MLSKFSLYDFIVAVIPGILFLWGLSILGAPIDISLTGGITETSVLIVLAYVLGLLLQGIGSAITEKILLKSWGAYPSAKWLLQDDDYFSKQYKENINKIVEKKYSLKLDYTLPQKEQLKKNQEFFQLCYNAVDLGKLSERPPIFNAHYGLFRSLLTTFVILLLLNMGAALINVGRSEASCYAFSIVYFICAIISYFRAKKRGEDFVRSVYDLFIAQF